jgi:rRNA maturation protein Nop10
VFLESCPACGGDPELGEETVESCCRQAEVYTYSCPDCGARLLEIEQ